MILRESILNAALQVFNKKGIKLTMDDVAKQLGISKKTIYAVFHDKEDMLLGLVDYIFDSIKVQEEKLMADDTISTEEKLRKILAAMPEAYLDMEYIQLYALKQKHPKIYERVTMRLETGWDMTIRIIENGIEEGVFRNVNIPIIKMMYEASLVRFMEKDISGTCGITYEEALDEAVKTIVNGIMVNN